MTLAANVAKVNMRVRYDEQVDALYIRLKETSYHESDEIREGFIVDYDKDGNVIESNGKLSENPGLPTLTIALMG